MIRKLKNSRCRQASSYTSFPLKVATSVSCSADRLSFDGALTIPLGDAFLSRFEEEYMVSVADFAQTYPLCVTVDEVSARNTVALEHTELEMVIAATRTEESQIAGNASAPAASEVQSILFKSESIAMTAVQAEYIPVLSHESMRLSRTACKCGWLNETDLLEGGAGAVSAALFQPAPPTGTAKYKCPFSSRIPVDAAHPFSQRGDDGTWLSVESASIRALFEQSKLFIFRKHGGQCAVVPENVGFSSKMSSGFSSSNSSADAPSLIVTQPVAGDLRRAAQARIDAALSSAATTHRHAPDSLVLRYRRLRPAPPAPSVPPDPVLNLQIQVSFTLWSLNIEAEVEAALGQEAAEAEQAALTPGAEARPAARAAVGTSRSSGDCVVA